jgi:NhaP-type Na+/H+ or K+/H+ antiporter
MIYQYLVTLALFIFFYSIIATRMEKTAFSGPVLALVFGVVVGPLFLNLLNSNLETEWYKTLAEIALALVLFTDASNTNLQVLQNNIKIPARLLLIGLPLTIVFGAVVAYMLFEGFSWVEVGILATMLAPTDAALGKAVVTNPSVPSKIREALNVESGLNDGISVPVLFLFIAMFTGNFADNPIDDINFQFGMGLFIKQIGIGLLVGGVLAFVGDWLIHRAAKRSWISSSWKPIVLIALALGCFAMAQALGGSGFIASFSGGLIYGAINRKHKLELLEAAEGFGDSLSMMTWVIFGAIIIEVYLPHFTWQIVLYALLSLTFIRIIPVFLSLIRTGISFKEKLFIAWFGPRGLASIVFAIIVMGVNFPHNATIILTVICTILFSVILHGISANTSIKRLNKSLDKKKQ